MHSSGESTKAMDLIKELDGKRRLLYINYRSCVDF